MNLAPFARSFLRYGIGYLAGSEVGTMLASDPDVVTAVALVMAALVEGVYVYAKKNGWNT